jgi:transcriptional antiterminator NusG
MQEGFVNDSFASGNAGSEYDDLDRGSYGAGDFDASQPSLGADEPYEDRAPEDEVTEQQSAEVKPAWYVVHCYSGYENKVKKNLEHRAESMGMTTHILEVIVPTEEQVELKEGQRRVVERRIYPGYVLVKMILDEESWYVVRNTPGVTGFVGIGNKVRIVEGNFLDFTGTVDEVYPDKGKARVLVSFFNRETPVEVDLLQIERL